jgi:hypothetical protein
MQESMFMARNKFAENVFVASNQQVEEHGNYANI